MQWHRGLPGFVGIRRHLLYLWGHRGKKATMTAGKAGLRQRRHHLVPFGSTADKIRRHELRQDNGCPDDYGTIH